MTRSRKYNSFLLIAGLAVSLLLATIGAAAQTKFRGTMVSPDYLKASDLVTLGQWKANLIRWQLVVDSPEVTNPDFYRQWLDLKLIQLDQMLPVCQANGLRVVIDMHTPPGGYDRQAKEHRIFRESVHRREIIASWEKIAQRYKNSPVVWGYDLVNEPHFRDVRKWQSLAQDLAEKIRAIDRTHRIIVESRYGHPNHIDELRPLPNIGNVVYSVHMYAPMQFTHQGIYGFPFGVNYPGKIVGVNFNRAELERQLRPVVDFQRRHRVPIYIGEFSAARWAPNNSSYNYLRDLIGIFEDNGWDWTYHAFGDALIWNVEYCPVPGAKDPTELQPCPTPSSSKLLLQRSFARNR
jgi:hypothetical protein